MSSKSRSIERAAAKRNKNRGSGDYQVITRIMVFLLIFLVGSGVTFVSSAYLEDKADELYVILLIWGGILISMLLGSVLAVTMRKPVELPPKRRSMPLEREYWKTNKGKVF